MNNYIVVDRISVVAARDEKAAAFACAEDKARDGQRQFRVYKLVATAEPVEPVVPESRLRLENKESSDA